MRPSARGKHKAGLEPGPWSEWLSPRGCQQPISIRMRLGQGWGEGPPTPTSEAQLTPFTGRDQNAWDRGFEPLNRAISPPWAASSLGLEQALRSPFVYCLLFHSH